jgi:DNA-binding MarR family transcriptional regulator
LKLEQKGFAKLTKDGENARRLCIRLTPKSEVFNKVYHEKSLLFFNQLFANLSASDLSATKNVISSLKEILERMEKEYVTE